MTVEKLIEKWEAIANEAGLKGTTTYRNDTQASQVYTTQADTIDAIIDDLRKLVKPLPEAQLPKCPDGYTWEKGKAVKSGDIAIFASDYSMAAGEILETEGLVSRVKWPDGLIEGRYNDDITHVARPVREVN